MPATKPTVLITGCSDGSLGSSLAIALAPTRRVFATARSPSKLSAMEAADIETLSLDVLSSDSIAACVASVRSLTGGSLDMLINNAGNTYFTTLADTDIAKAKELFDLNVWAHLEMFQAFLPLLLASKRDGGPVLVNHTSTSSIMAPPFTALYGSSKATLGMMTDALRFELQPFGINVVDLKTSSTVSNLNGNQVVGAPKVPKGSLYWPAREWLDLLYTGEPFMNGAQSTENFGRVVAKELTKRKPRDWIWAGGFPWTFWFITVLPRRWGQAILASVAGMAKVDGQIQAYGVERVVKEAVMQGKL